MQASPSSLKEDALSVAKHVTTKLGVENLVIHGESIGGMAAASTAYQLCKQKKRARNGDDFNLVSDAPEGISLLVCDRTFCNLIAVAQRLVGEITLYRSRFMSRIVQTFCRYWTVSL